nr:hypothetical protein [uncultured Psychroserpens sp.]
MKDKNLKYTILILATTLAFFLGRESKILVPNQPLTNAYTPNSFNSNAVKQKRENSASYLPNNIQVRLELSDSVYRCGQSKIYHPKLTHGSFKNCKSKVYKLTVERAKELGMRHCRCSS